MKDVIEILCIWIIHIGGLFALYLITGIGIALLKTCGMNYENTACVIYGYIIGIVCNKIIWRCK